MPSPLARALWIAVALAPAGLLSSPALAQSMHTISPFIQSHTFSNPMPYQQPQSGTPEQRKEARAEKQAATRASAVPTGRVGTATAPAVYPVRYEKEDARPR